MPICSTGGKQEAGVRRCRRVTAASKLQKQQAHLGSIREGHVRTKALVAAGRALLATPQHAAETCTQHGSLGTR